MRHRVSPRLSADSPMEENMVRSKYLNIGAALLAIAGLDGAVLSALPATRTQRRACWRTARSTPTSTTGRRGANTTLVARADDRLQQRRGSGSARLTYTGRGAGDATVVSDCIDLTTPGDGTYNIEGQAQRNPSNWSGQGTPATSTTRRSRSSSRATTTTACTTQPADEPERRRFALERWLVPDPDVGAGHGECQRPTGHHR